MARIEKAIAVSVGEARSLPILTPARADVLAAGGA
jgi:hypothetical protein